MVSDDELTRHLMSFGFNEREARLYHHLLKYGARPPAVIARHMRTYREDVHRTLNALLDKGMVAKSLSAPTVYIAVPLKNALDGFFVQHELQKHEKATHKRELIELAETVQVDSAFQDSAEGCRYRVLSGANQVDAASKQLNSEATSHISSLMPGPFLGILYLTGQLDIVPDFDAAACERASLQKSHARI